MYVYVQSVTRFAREKINALSFESDKNKNVRTRVFSRLFWTKKGKHFAALASGYNRICIMISS